MADIDFPPYAELILEKDLKAVRIKWKRLFLKLEEFKEIVEAGLNIMKENQAHIWISDMYESEGVFPKEIVSYITSDDTTAKSNEMGLNWALTINPKQSGLSSLSTKKWQKELINKDTLLVRDFPTLDSCKKWIEAQAN